MSTENNIHDTQLSQMTALWACVNCEVRKCEVVNCKVECVSARCLCEVRVNCEVTKCEA